MDRAQTISDRMDALPVGRFQMVTMLLCGMVIVLDGFDAQSIGFLAPSMADSLHVPVRTFGPVFGAALFGLMISSLTAGLLADRWGRKWPIIGCTTAFGVFAALTARVTTVEHLILMRFLTGLGLGGALTNVTALLSEYSPKRLLSVHVSYLYAMMPFGAMLGGVAGWVILPRWGWHSVFYAGGILPLTLSIFLIALLPESVRFLEVGGADPRKIAKLMARVSPELAAPELYVGLQQEDQRKPFPVKYLFAEGRAAGTFLLWIPFFMNLLILYFVVNWLPSLLRQTGLPVTAGITAVILFSAGGIAGSAAQGNLITRWGAFRLMLVEFAVSALLIAGLAYSSYFPLTMLITLIIGFVVQGAQGALAVVASSYYPTAIRSTGVGWALGIGRIGSIVGPLLGGWMLTMRWTPREIFLAGTIPAACAAAAMLISVLRQRNPRTPLLDTDSPEELPASHS